MQSKEYFIGRIKEEITVLEREILKHIDSDKKTVAFVSYLLNYRNQVGNLHKQFKEAGFNVINIVKERINDRFEKQAPTFVIPKQIATPYGDLPVEVDFEFIDLIISPDAEFITLPPYNKNFLSKKAKKIYLTHDVFAGGVHDFFDYVILPSEFSLELHKKRNHRTGLCLIPGGYPKLDYSIERYENHKNRLKNINEDSILYAPTVKRGGENFEEEQASFLIGFDSNIIEFLIRNFKEKIIYRPHPDDISKNHYVVKIIKDKFQTTDRVIFNYNYKYIDKYIRSKFLITDISDTAFTYSLTTIKPAIYFVPYNYDLSQYKTQINKLLIRQIGFIVKTLSELINCCKKINKQPLRFGNNIKKLRESVLNLRKSGEYLIENINYIINNKPHPDWIYF